MSLREFREVTARMIKIQEPSFIDEDNFADIGYFNTRDPTRLYTAELRDNNSWNVIMYEYDSSDKDEEGIEQVLDTWDNLSTEEMLSKMSDLTGINFSGRRVMPGEERFEENNISRFKEALFANSLGWEMTQSNRIDVLDYNREYVIAQAHFYKQKDGDYKLGFVQFTKNANATTENIIKEVVNNLKGQRERRTMPGEERFEDIYATEVERLEEEEKDPAFEKYLKTFKPVPGIYGNPMHPISPDMFKRRMSVGMPSNWAKSIAEGKKVEDVVADPALNPYKYSKEDVSWATEQANAKAALEKELVAQQPTIEDFLEGVELPGMDKPLKSKKKASKRSRKPT